MINCEIKITEDIVLYVGQYYYPDKRLYFCNEERELNNLFGIDQELGFKTVEEARVYAFDKVKSFLRKQLDNLSRY